MEASPAFASASASASASERFRSYPVLGHAPHFKGRGLFDTFVEMSRHEGECYKVKLPGSDFWLVSSANIMRELCDETRFSKRIIGTLKELQNVVGRGLFTAETEDPLWSSARKQLAPGFHAKAMQNYHAEMRNQVCEMVGFLQNSAEKSKDGKAHFDVVDEFSRLTLEVITRCGFNFPLNLRTLTEPHPFVVSLGKALGDAGEMVKKTKLARLLSWREEKAYRKNIEGLYKMVDDILEPRIRQAKQKTSAGSELLKAGSSNNSGYIEPFDLLSLMLKDVEGETVLPYQNIREQLLTFLVAGHETTSGSLSFLLGLLAQNPNTVNAIRTEVADLLKGRDVLEIAFQDAIKMRYIQAVIHEGLRLWSPASLVSVVPKMNTVLAGKYPVKTTERAVCLLWAIHRDKSEWGEDAEEFKPERFLVSSEHLKEKIYNPFGIGARACIGKWFAIHEMTLALAILCTKFDFETVSGYPFKVIHQLTIKPEGLMMSATPRAPAH